MLKSIILIQGKFKLIRRMSAYRNFNKPRYKESFQYRILDYFESVQNIENINQQHEISSQIRENLSEVSVTKEKYKSIYTYFKQLLNATDLDVNKNLLHDLDMQCSSLVHLLRHSEILSLLNAFLKLAPNRCQTTNFYNKSISILLKAVECELLNSHQIVQVIFFLSLKKSDDNGYIKYLRSYFTNLTNLSLIEKCIVAQAFYKASVKLEQCQSQIFEKVIENEYNDLIADQLLLVSICKVIRISGASDELKLKPLSEAISNTKITFTFPTIVHVLGLYAEVLTLETKAIDRLKKDSIEIIREDSLKNTLRLKDFDRFLWGLGHLGVDLTLKQKLLLQMYFEQRLMEYKNKENLGILVNSILSLHMLQCWNKKIIKSLLEENIFLPVFYEKFHWKIRSRLQLLISQITIEMKLFAPEPLKKQKTISYPTSEFINSIVEIASSSSLFKNRIIKHVILECPIRTLQIPGVTLITEKNIYHIDVLDNVTCLKNTNIPHGLMKLKIRLLSILKYQQIAISNEVFKDFKSSHTRIEQQIINNIIEEKTLKSFKDTSLTL